MKRILIDGRFVGVGDSQTRYVLEMTRGILANDSENIYTLLIRPIGKKELKWYPEIEGAKNLKVEVLDIPHYSFAEQTKLLSYLNKQKYDLVHFTQFNHPIFYHGKYVTTIQDLTLIGPVTLQNFAKQTATNLVMASAAQSSEKVIAISKFTMNDVRESFRVAKERFVVIYHGVDHQKFNFKVRENIKGVEDIKKKYEIKGDYLLYVGAWKKHKNLLRMLEAFKSFKSETKNPIKLVLVGKADEKEPNIMEAISEINKETADSIILTGVINVRSDELPLFYAGARAYIIPSLAEGFGWPPLEAMACGTPVISSNVSCMPEILGDGVLYFDPYNIADIKNAIEKITSDEKLCKELIKKGLAKVSEYQWDTTAKETLKVYKEVLDK